MNSLFKGDDSDFLATSSTSAPPETAKQLFSGSGSDDFLHTSAIDSSFSLVDKSSSNNTSNEQKSTFPKVSTSLSLNTKTTDLNTNLMSSFGSSHMNATSSPTKLTYMNSSFPYSNNNAPQNFAQSNSPTEVTQTLTSYGTQSTLPTFKPFPQQTPAQVTNTLGTPTNGTPNVLPTFKPPEQQPPPALSSPHTTQLPTPPNMNDYYKPQLPNFQNNAAPASIPPNPLNQQFQSTTTAQFNHTLTSSQNSSYSLPPTNNSPYHNQQQQQQQQKQQPGLFIPSMYSSQSSKETSQVKSSFFVPSQPTETSPSTNTMEPYNPSNYQTSANNNTPKQQHPYTQSHNQQQGYNIGYSDSYQTNSPTGNIKANQEGGIYFFRCCFLYHFSF